MISHTTLGTWDLATYSMKGISVDYQIFRDFTDDNNLQI